MNTHVELKYMVGIFLVGVFNVTAGIRKSTRDKRVRLVTPWGRGTSCKNPGALPAWEWGLLRASLQSPWAPAALR